MSCDENCHTFFTVDASLGWLIMWLVPSIIIKGYQNSTFWNITVDSIKSMQF